MNVGIRNWILCLVIILVAWIVIQTVKDQRAETIYSSSVICHACKCEKPPDKCVNECNSPKICVIMCASQCDGQKSVVGRSPDLTQEFEDLNAKYFGGSLNNVEVDLSNQKEDDWIGLTTPCGDGKYCILINTWLTPAPKEREWVLLHETCHVYIYEKETPENDSHGPEWQTCMLNLAEKGAFKNIW